MADRFFTDQPLMPGEFTLTGADAHHLATVRRFQPGDQVTLFNGDGRDYPAEVLAIGKKTTLLNVQSAVMVERELDFSLIVASALPKGDRSDFLIEKLTELGVTQFVPLITTRSVVVPRDNIVEKLTRSVIEASKQCGRSRLMRVEAPQKWDTFLGRAAWPDARCVLHTSPSSFTITRHDDLSPDVVIAVGPEGGFTDTEITRAIEAGWHTLNLGPRVLRVETAAIAAAALLSRSPLYSSVHGKTTNSPGG